MEKGEDKRRLVCSSINYPETRYVERLEQQEERRNFRGRNCRSKANTV